MKALIIIGFFCITTAIALIAFDLIDVLYEKVYFNRLSHPEKVEILKKLDYNDQEILEFFNNRR